MQRFDLHISRYSGSIIEAEQLGVYSIIIDAMGKETYSSIINRGKAFYLESDEDLSVLIDETLTKPPIEIENKGDNEMVKLFLKDLLNQRDN